MKTLWRYIGAIALLFLCTMFAVALFEPAQEGNSSRGHLSRCRNLSSSLQIYAIDSEGRYPIYVSGGAKRLTSWYNGTAPYIRQNVDWLRPRFKYERSNSVEKLAYRDLVIGVALNSNLATVQRESDFAQPELTVLLFETKEYTSYLGPNGENGVNGVVSASGNGFGEDLFDSPDGKSKTGKAKYLAPEDYSGQHVYVTVNGNAKVIQKSLVGVGGSFSAKGCLDLVTGDRVPCAPSVLGRRGAVPTFSIR